MRDYHICPACGGDQVVRSRRAPAVVRWVARCFLRRQYRCKDCYSRFWDRSGRLGWHDHD